LEGKKIASFRDLEVYQEAYELSILVAKQVVSKLPASEKFDLQDQLSRSSKAIPRLIAEGYGKKHQKAGFQKYLDDAMSESNETIVSICHGRDIYKIDKILCDELVERYDVLGRRIYRLSESWDKFYAKGRSSK